MKKNVLADKKNLDAKLESAYSFMLRYSKITVWDGSLIGGKMYSE